MKIAVVGSRSVTVADMDRYISACDEIVSGGAVGVDSCAAEFACFPWQATRSDINPNRDLRDTFVYLVADEIYESAIFALRQAICFRCFAKGVSI